MRVLIACEESQVVCKAFRERGHEAYSCDLQPCSGGFPEWHYQTDVFEVIGLGWDLMIGHPPCTYLANAGAVWHEQRRKEGVQQLAIKFFMDMYNAPVDRVCIENPVGIMSTLFRKPDQVVQPFYFGDPLMKATHLWLRGLPKLVWVKNDDLYTRSEFVQPMETGKTMIRKGSYRTGTVRKLYWQDLVPKKDRSKIKSKTFQGIARAMAEQWG